MAGRGNVHSRCDSILLFLIKQILLVHKYLKQKIGLQRSKEGMKIKPYKQTWLGEEGLDTTLGISIQFSENYMLTTWNQ